MTKKDQDNLARLYCESFRDGPGYGEEFYDERKNAPSQQFDKKTKYVVEAILEGIRMILDQPINPDDPYDTLRHLEQSWRERITGY